jgi:hypothetical protein
MRVVTGGASELGFSARDLETGFRDTFRAD